MSKAYTPAGTHIGDRLMAMSVPSGTCREWVAAKNSGGYGLVHFEGKHRLAHRVSYQEFIGPVPEGRELDHVCRNRACINPLHLEPVTKSENVRRGKTPAVNRARHAAQTHCKHGHPLSGDNLYVCAGTRFCRECGHVRQKKYRDRKRAATNGELA